VKTGHSSVKPLNNVTKQNNVRRVPSNGLCSKNLCDGFDMVFIVKSFVGNFGQRIAIRNTWGKAEIIRLKTVFVLGYIKDMQNYIDLESEKFQDILQFDMTIIFMSVCVMLVDAKLYKLNVLTMRSSSRK
jgi:hypothetical protein